MGESVTQLDITFDAVRFPRARVSDPTGSHEAAARMERTGKAKAQAEQVLAAFRRFPMATSAELAKLANLDRVMVARRCPELAKVGLLTRYEGKDAKPCDVTGIRCVRWRT